MKKNLVCNVETPPPPLPPQAHNDLQHLLQNFHCKMLQNGMVIACQAMKEINLTPALLLITVEVGNMTMKCTPD